MKKWKRYTKLLLDGNEHVFFKCTCNYGGPEASGKSYERGRGTLYVATNSLIYEGFVIQATTATPNSPRTPRRPPPLSHATLTGSPRSPLPPPFAEFAPPVISRSDSTDPIPSPLPPLVRFPLPSLRSWSPVEPATLNIDAAVVHHWPGPRAGPYVVLEGEFPASFSFDHHSDLTAICALLTRFRQLTLNNPSSASLERTILSLAFAQLARCPLPDALLSQHHKSPPRNVFEDTGSTVLHVRSSSAAADARRAALSPFIRNDEISDSDFTSDSAVTSGTESESGGNASTNTNAANPARRGIADINNTIYINPSGKVVATVAKAGPCKRPTGRLFEAFGLRVRPLERTPARLLLTETALYLHMLHRCHRRTSTDLPKVRCWPLSSIIEAYPRTHRREHTAVEVFFDNPPDSSLLFSFSSVTEAQQFLSVLIDASDGSVASPDSYEHLEATMDSWRAGEISNYGYLLYLNKQAGRTFQDLSQYPVFPWVIADYNSQNLDLESSNTFRDLSRPMGAINDRRFQAYQERFESGLDVDLGIECRPFLYGTHYSNPYIVANYLVRSHPEWMLNLFGGQFDNPDRLFVDIKQAWLSACTNPSDVSELTPEFYQPVRTGSVFLESPPGLDLGTRQDGSEVSHVTLPRWCHGDRHEFVRLCRQALESDHVSTYLHFWIDLMFGFKQRGEYAVEAKNVFHEFTYEEGWNRIYSVKDPKLRSALQMQAIDFGQCPRQLFITPHLPRGDFDFSADDDVSQAASTTAIGKARRVGVRFGIPAAAAVVGSLFGPFGAVAGFGLGATVALFVNSYVRPSPTPVTNASVIAITGPADDGDRLGTLPYTVSTPRGTPRATPRRFLGGVTPTYRSRSPIPTPTSMPTNQSSPAAASSTSSGSANSGSPLAAPVQLKRGNSLLERELNAERDAATALAATRPLHNLGPPSPVGRAQVLESHVHGQPLQRLAIPLVKW